MIKRIIAVIRSIRQKYWASRLKSCGSNFVCCSGVVIHGAKKMSIGNDVRLGEKSYLNANGGLIIGNNVKMGPQVFIWTSDHNYISPKWLPFDNVTPNKPPVTIGDNVWVGSKVIIVPGVKIGEGAVLAMGAVVTRDVPPCAVVGGNPANIIKYRNIETYNKLKSAK